MTFIRKLKTLFGMKKKAKTLPKKTVNVATQTDAILQPAEQRRHWNLDDFKKEASMYDFFGRRNLQWPSKKSLPWKMTIGKLYPSLEEFI